MSTAFGAGILLYQPRVQFSATLKDKERSTMPKTGRPKKENPKLVKYSVRFDIEMERELREYCVRHGITRMEAIRQALSLLMGGGKNV